MVALDMKDMTLVIETPLIGSGSQEEADARVKALLDLGTSRGYLTYEELNERLPDEVVSPDKLDSLLMMIDEMGIRLIDETDVADFTASLNVKVIKVAKVKVLKKGTKDKLVKPQPDSVLPPELTPQPGEEAEEEIDLNLDEELAEASAPEPITEPMLAIVFASSP